MKGILAGALSMSAMLSLTGCIATFSAVVRNESNGVLTAVSVDSPTYREVINPRKSKRIQWSHYCQVFLVDGRKRYFDTYMHVPEAEMFSIGPDTKLRVLYEDSHLYFDGGRKGLTEIPEVENCEERYRPRKSQTTR